MKIPDKIPKDLPRFDRNSKIITYLMTEKKEEFTAVLFSIALRWTNKTLAPDVIQGALISFLLGFEIPKEIEDEVDTISDITGLIVNWFKPTIKRQHINDNRNGVDKDSYYEITDIAWLNLDQRVLDTIDLEDLIDEIILLAGELDYEIVVGEKGWRERTIWKLENNIDKLRDRVRTVIMNERPDLQIVLI